MLNKERHQLIMGQILKDIYTDVEIAPLLGFKGGTCCYFFYDLPRFSTDLDFDLLKTDKKSQEITFSKIEKILQKYGKIKDKYIKKNTIFMLLSYGDQDHNIKVEISKRQPILSIKDLFEIKKYLGISILTARKDYLFAGKLVALTLRKQIAMRDVYDIYFFGKNNWDINHDILKEQTNKKTKEYLIDCIRHIEKIKDNQILTGLGELFSAKEKKWIKQNLKSEVIFMLKNYISIY